jgi:hypothetical protein
VGENGCVRHSNGANLSPCSSRSGTLDGIDIAKYPSQAPARTEKRGNAAPDSRRRSTLSGSTAGFQTVANVPRVAVRQARLGVGANLVGPQVLYAVAGALKRVAQGVRVGAAVPGDEEEVRETRTAVDLLPLPSRLPPVDLHLVGRLLLLTHPGLSREAGHIANGVRPGCRERSLRTGPRSSWCPWWGTPPLWLQNEKAFRSMGSRKALSRKKRFSFTPFCVAAVGSGE